MSRLRSEIEQSRDRARRWAGPSRGDDELARLAKALGHPVRAAIVRLLHRQGRCSCGEIVDVLPLAQATISQHLKVLKDAGLLLGEVEGPRVCYCVNPDAIQRVRHLVGEL